MRIRLLATILFSVTIAARAEAQFNVPDPAPAENFHVELGLMFWKPTPGIEIQTGGSQQRVSHAVDFVREFELLDERFLEFRSVIKTGRKHKFRISHVTFDYNAADDCFSGRSHSAARPSRSRFRSPQI